jgi:hypothetical protein
MGQDGKTYLHTEDRPMKYIALAVVISAGALLTAVGVVANTIAATAPRPSGSPGNEGITFGVVIAGFGVLVWLYEMIPVPRRDTQHRPQSVSGNGHSAPAR